MVAEISMTPGIPSATARYLKSAESFGLTHAEAWQLAIEFKGFYMQAINYLRNRK